MKRRLNVALACLVVAGCQAGHDDDTQTVSETTGELSNGQAEGSFLTKLTYDEPLEQNRELNTEAYYLQLRIGPDGASGPALYPQLATLANFKTWYGFGTETPTSYYNRGDLGIGREMHCVDHLTQADQQIACYVRNFAAGDDKSEFTFGESPNIAFSNLHAGRAFATVAMVFRNLSPIGSENRVFFVVYDQNDNIAFDAALDRHGVTFAQAFHGNAQIQGSQPNNPDTAFGTPGLRGTLNNHIPSNCIACHGGSYSSTTKGVLNALFLPFDLDQFDYEDVPGGRRADQLTAFKHQNEMVRKVAAYANATGGASVVGQLDNWYDNVFMQPTNAVEVFENDFRSTAVPRDWTGNADIYYNVVRPSCRTCHLANALGRSFAREDDFKGAAQQIADDLCNYRMPHSLQAAREFWLSNRPAKLAAYFDGFNAPAAATLRSPNCRNGLRDVVTLDPPQLTAVLNAASVLQ